MAAALCILLPGVAHAHGHLERAIPAAGAKLGAAPHEIRLAFSETPELAITAVRLVGPDGEDVRLGPLATVPDSERVILAPIPGALAAGDYTVVWQMTATDGHPTHGSFSFTILPGASGIASTTASAAARRSGVESGSAVTQRQRGAVPASHHRTSTTTTADGFGAESPLYVLVRWIGFAALLVVVGAVAFRWWVLPRAHVQNGAEAAVLRGAAEWGAARTGNTATVVLAIAAVLRLLAQSYALHGSGGAFDPSLMGVMITRTLWGWAWLLQVLAVGVALAGFRHAGRAAPASASRSTRSARNGWRTATAAAVLLAFASALSGHAAGTPGWSALAVTADLVHLLAAGAWLGCLYVVLSVGIPAAGRAGEGRARGAAALVNAFSPVALASAATVAATGVFAAAIHLPGVASLWQSTYGRTLLLKLAFLTGVLATGAYNWKRVRPALGEETGVVRLRRSAGVELATGLVVLLVTAVLVATATPDPM